MSPNNNIWPKTTVRTKLTFKDVSLVLAGGLLRGSNISRREREEGASLNLTEGHIGVSHKVVELIHKVLRH